MFWETLGYSHGFFLAFLSVLFYNFIYGWLYLVLLAFVVYAVLRRLGCGNCYKCKACTSGFGRLAGVFFGKGFVKKDSLGNRLVLAAAAAVYVLLLPLPAGLLAVSLFSAFSIVKVLVLVCLLAVAVYSLTTWYSYSTATEKT